MKEGVKWMFGDRYKIIKFYLDMLEHLFGSTTRVKLLRLFYNNQDRAYFVRELSRVIDIQLNAVRRELANLEELGLVKQVAFGESKEEEVGGRRQGSNR